MIILHSLTKKFWDTYKNNNFYGDLALDKYGFIHCSDVSTYHYVAPNFKDESEEMILLVIDTDKVTSKIVWEDLNNCGIKFPHIYGLLNKSAVISILPHLWNEKKEWVMNDELYSEQF